MPSNAKLQQASANDEPITEETGAETQQREYYDIAQSAAAIYNCLP